MDEKNIVSIDLGSSKIALAVAKVDGRNIEMLYYKETPSDGIVRGAVANVKKASAAIENAIREAEESLGMKITGAVVSMPKYPIVQKSSIASMDRDGNNCVEQGEIDILRENAINGCLDDENEDEVYEAVAQSYSDEDDFQITEDAVIGRTSCKLEGNFNVYVGKKKNLSAIDKAFNEAGRSCGVKFFPGLATAQAALSEDEKDNGVALVDIGAGATSVAIYKGGILRYYDSIPFGGQLITKDIQSICRIGEKLAENIKKAYGVCIPEKLYNLGDKILKIQGDKEHASYELQVKLLSKIVTARMKEILDAVLFMIQESGYADNLIAGIVLTGGGANIANCRILLKEMSGLSVRIGFARTLYTSSGFVDGINGTAAATAVGMMVCARDRGYSNCAIPADAVPAESKTAPIMTEETQAEDNVFSTTGDERQSPSAPIKPVIDSNTGKKVFWNPLTHQGQQPPMPGNEPKKEAEKEAKKTERKKGETPDGSKGHKRTFRESIGHLFDTLTEEDPEKEDKI